MSALARQSRQTQCARTAASRARVVLLGASNLTKGIGTVVETAAARLGPAAGSARGAGAWPVLWPRQPACWAGSCRASWSAGCGRALAARAGVADRRPGDRHRQRPAVRRAGRADRRLGRSSASIGWPRRDARTVVTLLPVDNLAALSQARFHLLRTLFFPRSRLESGRGSPRERMSSTTQRAAAGRRARIRRRRAIARRGTDSIRSTFDSRQRRQAWREILGRWSRIGRAARAGGARLRGRCILRTLRAPERRARVGLRAARRAALGALARRHDAWRSTERRACGLRESRRCDALARSTFEHRVCASSRDRAHARTDVASERSRIGDCEKNLSTGKFCAKFMLHNLAELCTNIIQIFPELVCVRFSREQAATLSLGERL